jgi:hypothetical protein
LTPQNMIIAFFRSRTEYLVFIPMGPIASATCGCGSRSKPQNTVTSTSTFILYLYILRWSDVFIGFFYFPQYPSVSICLIWDPNSPLVLICVQTARVYVLNDAMEFNSYIYIYISEQIIWLLNKSLCHKLLVHVTT